VVHLERFSLPFQALTSDVCSTKSLLELLEDKVHVGDDVTLVLNAIQCLCDLSHHVHVRLMTVADLVLFCPDQGLV